MLNSNTRVQAHDGGRLHAVEAQILALKASVKGILKIGWKLVGFPGVAAAYSEFIDKHNVPYKAEPVSIADLQQRAIAVDEHGHPLHVLLAKKD